MRFKVTKMKDECLVHETSKNDFFITSTYIPGRPEN